MNILKEYVLEEVRLHVIHPTQKGHIDKEAGKNNKEKEVEAPSSIVDPQEPKLTQDFHDTVDGP